VRGRRTIRGSGEYGPQINPEPLVCTLRNLDSPRAHYGQYVTHGRSGLSRRTVRPTASKQNLLTQRIKTKRLKNSRRTRRTPGRSTPRGRSADQRRRSARHKNSNPSRKPQAQEHLSIHGSHKRLELLR
jgi:hypothetical protein